MVIKIGITGSRSRDTFEDFHMLDVEIWKFIVKNQFDIDEIHLVYGGAYEGADKFAEQICKQYNFDSTVYRPRYKRYGKKAPILRNTKIANNSDYLFALWDGESKGTEDTIDKFLENHPRDKLILMIKEKTKEDTDKVLSYTKDKYSF